jgi:asparagine synthase (glutamine-hydrolysing)
MTAIAAVFRADGSGDAGCEDPGGVRRMLDAAAHRGGGPAVVWTSESCTIGYRGSIGRDGLPRAAFASAPDGSVVAFDGRLDNGDDLRAALASGSTDDPSLLLAAYEKRADEAPALLLGDFAFALWDARRRRLVCARDVFGQRPLFYASGRGITVVASEPQQLLAHPDIPRRVNEGVVAERLAAAPTSVEETLWSGINRLPPAHAAIISGTGIRRFRYWDFDPDARLECGRDEEYAARFMDLLRSAIACRTRDASTVGVFLSGGLDSSAIAGTAQMLARERGAAPVRAFSLTFPGSEADETPYIDAVVQQWSLPSVRLPARCAMREDIEREVARYRDVPQYPNGFMLDALRQRAAADVDVVLTGYGGDDWFTGGPLHTADLLRGGRLAAAARQYWSDTALPGRSFTRLGLLRTAVAPLLPRAARPALRPLAGGSRRTHEWIRPEFAERTALRDRLRWPEARACRTLVQTEIRRMINAPVQILGDELEDRAAAAACLEQRHPFNDRRLAEFGFALPESQRWAGGETKLVMRRALKTVLPPAVARRNDKAEFSSTFVDTIENLGGRRFFSGLRTAEAGWIDEAVVQRTYERMAALYRRRDEAYIPLADAIWGVGAIELWLTAQDKERCP